MDAIILAGGKGTRMEDPLPKALVLAKKVPIIDYQLNYLLNNPLIDKIILGIGFKSDLIISHVQQKYPKNRVLFSIEDKPLGTGGAIKQALKQAQSERVLILNGDDITNIDLNKISQIKGNVLCAAHPVLPFGIVKEDKSGKVIFTEKPKLNEWVSCGWYLLNREFLLKELPDVGSIEYDIFPNITLNLYKHTNFWHSLNSKKDILEFEKTTIPNILNLKV